MRRAIIGGIALGLVVGGAGWAQSGTNDKKLDQQQQIIQALNRLTWGIAPGDVALVERMGLKNWIHQQLHPSTVLENPELTAALAPLDTLRMTPGEVEQHYPRPKAKKAKKAKDGTDGTDGKDENNATDARGLAELGKLLTPEQVAAITRGNPRQRVAELESLPAATRDQALQDLPQKDAQQLSPWVPLGQQHAIVARLRPVQVPALDLLGAKVLRAVYTNRQLEDVLTDFWFNHFNVYIRKGQDRDYITAYERDAIRPHVLGKFSDLLLATAESPAMLFYLDNWQSVDPNAQVRGRRFAAPKPGAPKRGINENYGREVMELQTLGVNGGYTQKDVTEVARCFTGWTIRQPGRAAEFVFNPNLHENGSKLVLGVKIPAGGGMADGLRVIQILSRSPATAQHISYELAQRFVADEPPPALVQRMTSTYMRSDGDLRQVMETMIQSPEFWQSQYYRNKVKSPLEMVVSAVRALGAGVSNPTRLTQVIAGMGQPLYGKEFPTGYKNVGAAWVSSSGLVARLNFALQLARNQVPGVQVDVSSLTAAGGGTAALEQSVFQSLLYDQVSPGTQATVERMVASHPPAAPAAASEIAGLVLGSPDFQRR